MSCLYPALKLPSLAVTALKLLALNLVDLKVLALDCCCHSRSARCGTHQAHRTAAVQFHTDFAIHRGQQRRVPQQFSARRCLHLSFCLPKQAQVSRVSFQAQYQAFVRFAVGSSAALSAIALNWTCVLEPFNRAGSRLRTLAFTRSIYGASNPGPMLYIERSRSRGIFQGVFLHFNQALCGQFSARDRPLDTRQIGFGRPLAR
jgi:hypothetical protein